MTIAIVGILASMALPSMLQYVAKAKLANLQSEAESVETALQMYIAEYSTFGAHHLWSGKYPSSSLNLSILNSTPNHYLEQVRSVINADPNFQLHEMSSGQCASPGLTVLVEANHKVGLIGRGSTEYYLKYDLHGNFIGISPTEWNGDIDNRPWWTSKMYNVQMLESKVMQSNGDWSERCKS